MAGVYPVPQASRFNKITVCRGGKAVIVASLQEGLPGLDLSTGTVGMLYNRAQIFRRARQVPERAHAQTHCLYGCKIVELVRWCCRVDLLRGIDHFLRGGPQGLSEETTKLT